MLESTFGAKFQKWWNIKEDGVYVNRTCDQAAFEYKVTNGGTYNLNTWRKDQPHQEVGLRKAGSEEGVIWKISDLDPRSKDFDAFFLSNAPAYLVVLFNKHERFFIISVFDIPKQTSISYEYCCERWEAIPLPVPKKKYYDLGM